MQQNFAQALSFVLKSEGGDSNDAHDPGGATLNGIIQREYSAYLQRKGLPDAPARNMHPAERDEIYRTEYWDVLECHELPASNDFCAFDFGVNSGVGRAESYLKDLGQNFSIDAFCDRRLAFLKNLSTFRYFGAGWTSRVEFVRKNAKAMTSGEPIHDTAWVQASLAKLGYGTLATDGVEGAVTITASQLQRPPDGSGQNVYNPFFE